jgi:hypothetical protein
MSGTTSAPETAPSGGITLAEAKRLSDADPTFASVWVESGRICATLSDGRSVSIPLSWSWRLEAATPLERSIVEISPGGYTVHWPAVDEDLSSGSFLRGQPAKRLSDDRMQLLLAEARADYRAKSDFAALVPRVDVESLAAAKPLLNLASIARQAGMNPRTLTTKIDRGTPLTDEEAAALHRVVTSLSQALLQPA